MRTDAGLDDGMNAKMARSWGASRYFHIFNARLNRINVIIKWKTTKIKEEKKNGMERDARKTGKS